MLGRGSLVGSRFTLTVLLSGLLLSVLRNGNSAEDLTQKQRRELQIKATALNDQAIALYQRGAHREATTLLREVLAMRRVLFPAGTYPQGRPELAQSLNNLGFLLQAQREFARAEPFLREALAMNRALYPKDKYPRGHLELAGSLNNLGGLFQDQGEHAKAVPFYRAALRMRRALYPRQTFPQGHPDLALSLNNLGGLLQAQGEYAKAETLYREALELSRALYPPERFPPGHAHLARSLNRLAVALDLQGEFAKAESLYRDALTMRRALFPQAKYPQGHPELAQSLNNLGFVLESQGEYAKAEAFYRQCLEMERGLYPRQKFPHGHPDLALSVSNLGTLLQAQGEFAKAASLLGEALVMCRAVYPRENYPRGHPHLALSLNNLGFLLQEHREYGRAEPFLRDALKMRRALYPKDRFPRGHADLAQSLSNLGGLLYAQGQFARAEPLVRETLTMRRALYPREKFPQGHPDLARSLNQLGFVLLAQKEHARAEPFLRDALQMYRGHLLSVADGVSEAQALNFAVTVPLSQDAHLCVTRRLPSLTAVYDELWQRKALLSRILERRHLDLVASKDPKAHQLGRELTAARQRLARLLMVPVREAKEHARLLDKLTEDKEELEKQLARQLRLTTPSPTVLPPPRSLADALPKDAAFLDLMRYTDFEHDSTRPGKQGEEVLGRTWRYVAFVLRPGQKTAARVELGPAAPIEQAWAAWRQALVGKDAAGSRPDRAAAARFARLTWEPLRKHLSADLHTVYLSADAVLTQVPWAALPGTKPGTVLLEDHAIAVVPHGPWLLEQLKRKSRPRAADDLLLVAGGIAYDGAPAAVEKAPTEEVVLRAPPMGGKRVVWKELPGTAREYEQVVALARKVFRQAPLSRAGAVASTGQLQEDLSRVRYAHLATHGFFADAQFRSAFQVDESQYHLATRDRQTAGARSPLTLSGLVLAGANRSGKEAAPDRGILTAEALVGLRLDDMELAVLSACDTGRGSFDVAGGEGVYGLQRAFHLAGCKNVVASLWRVDDDATAALMGVFYRHLWVEKMPPLEALRQAQLYLYRNPSAVPALAKRRGDLFAEVDLPRETVKSGEQPKHAPTSQWAAFVLSGVGR